MNDFVKWLKDHWFLLAFIGATSMAWADNTNEVRHIKEVTSKLVVAQEKIQALELSQTRSEGKIDALKEQNALTNRYLEILIKSNPRTARELEQ